MKTKWFASLSVLLLAAVVEAQEPAAPAPNAQVPLTSSPPFEPGAFVPPGGLAAADRAPGAGDQFWVSGEYLLWWIQRSPEPVPLVTSSSPKAVSAPGQPPPGAIGGPTTTVLIGGQPIGTHSHSGGRVTAGYWLDDGHTSAIEADYFYLGSHGSLQTVSMTGVPGAPNIQVPFFDVTGFGTGGVPGEAVSFFISQGNPESGVRTLTITNRLQGAELNAERNLVNCNLLRLDLLGGFRWLQLHENLDFVFTEMAVPPSRQVGAFSDHLDQFHTDNNCYVGQVGLSGEELFGSWFVNLTGKIGLGDTNEVVDIAGTTTTNVITGQVNLATGQRFPHPMFATAQPQVLPGGFFAQPSNEGHHTRDVFAVLGEVDVQGGYRFGDWGRLFIGYSFMGVDAVARPGNQINRNINVSRQAQPSAAAAAGLPTPQQPNGPFEPSFSFHGSSFWAQGVNFGLEFRF
jgi:hypothetical protein